MGVITIVLLIVFVCVIFGGGIWLRRTFAPTLPPIFDTMLVIVCFIVVVMIILHAFGIGLPNDPKVPKLN